MLTGILENADSDKAGLFVQRYLRLFGFSKMKDSAVFVLLDSVISLPDGIFSDEEMADVLDFAEKVSVREPVEIKIGSLRVAEYISGRLRTAPANSARGIRSNNFWIPPSGTNWTQYT